MRLFVTGGTGTICSAVIPLLVKAGHSVRALARTPASEAKLQSLGAAPVRGNVKDLDVLATEARQADGVIYAAIDHFDPDREGQSRAEGEAVRMICAALEGTGKMVLAFFSLATFPSDTLSTEYSPLVTVLRGAAASKAFQEYATRGVRPVEIRVGLVHQSQTPSPMVARLVDISKKAGYVPYIDKGDQRWLVINLQDIAQLVLSVVDKLATIDKEGIVAVHAYDETVTAKQVADRLGASLDLPAKSVSPAEMGALDPMVAWFLGISPLMFNEWTRETFDWKPDGGFWENILPKKTT